MDSGENRKQGLFRRQQSPTLSSKDPSLSASRPGTSHPHHKSATHHHTRVDIDQDPAIPLRIRICTFLYNRNDKTFCGRTCISWLYIIMYSIVYTCFLSTFTILVLFGSLWCIRLTSDFQSLNKVMLLTYSEHGVGLSMTPISELYQPIIWYRKDQSQDYEKYVNALDDLLKKRRKQVNLGPCGVKPYGYASNTPCVILRLNKQINWAGEPMEQNSSLARSAPMDVQNWMKKDKKLWLHCEGFHPYDKEHIGRIRYFPDPPGFDPVEFPLSMTSESPLVAIQISDFSLGLSLAVECKLWYANGPAAVDFMLYVTTDGKTVSDRSNF